MTKDRISGNENRNERRVGVAVSGTESVGCGGWIRAEGREISDNGEGCILGLVGNERQGYKITSPALSFWKTRAMGYSLICSFNKYANKCIRIYSMSYTELGVNIKNWKAQFLFLNILG